MFINSYMSGNTYSYKQEMVSRVLSIMGITCG